MNAPASQDGLAAPLRIFLIAGEESGDQLGAGLMRAISDRARRPVSFSGIGGSRMEALGLRSQFPMAELSLHGIAEVLPAIGRILARRRQTVAAIGREQPDVLVLIDAPSFNLGLGFLVRRKWPRIPIVFYVSPSVWAYRPGRARWMARFVDRILAILPFEPAVHEALRGPPCTYVGHPLIEKIGSLRPGEGERPALDRTRGRTLLVLPGSRRSEVARLMPVFGRAVAAIAERRGEVEIVIPAVSRLAGDIRRFAADWSVKPTIVEGEEEKFAAFRRAHAALAASGTVTLELALAAVPMVVVYWVDPIARPVARLIVRVKSIVLANLVIGENVVPEFLNEAASAERLADEMVRLLDDTPERRRQMAAFARLDAQMSLGAETPSGRAADVVLDLVGSRRSGR
jgi:lipid-A-disaccharide synthase